MWGGAMTATTGQPAILIANDEPPFRRYIRLMLSVQGYRVLEARNALQALAKVERQEFDLVLVKFDLAGLEVIRHVRQTGAKLPLIVLLNQGDKRGKIKAFAEGADDCLIRPFPADQLIARIKAALARHGEPDKAASFISGIITVDLAHGTAMIGTKPLHLSPRESTILRLLIARAGRICSYSSLVQQVWGAKGEIRNLRNYIQQLRQKIEPDPSHPIYIVTEPSIGYRMVVA
jgi:two-component system, OmpR family, KDP operon response regulator KdpE